MLEENLLEAAENLRLERGLIFQQDNNNTGATVERLWSEQVHMLDGSLSQNTLRQKGAVWF